LLSVFAPFLSYAKTADVPFFQVSPTTCVLDTQQSLCKVTIAIKLTKGAFAEVCLEIENRPQHTQCYSREGIIEEHIMIAARHPVTIRIIDPTNHDIIQQQLLSIAHFDSKDYRVKRRFGWSF
jgi:hypothetical protein